ncbi:thiamine phosphate synthase [Staphylococcus gallinarum]|uniref:Thiamine-phosphate synthase n=1 Tax=Staphylococcus gallinarum TaxID=1293 RepID=A0ABQ0Y5P8_STAGA|nr:thiamine phosphate synthase [Staphylococcus gallinarum]KIR10996.1 thiamine-phosphate pyrophosphorylase [Staphylococcus gallinarum]RTX70784.1 thiamine phosphate synthase [Staphylococcus gallinarum]GEQ06722.1 thiamine-phosphate synthase [Staphylococcus gallinarum]
MFDKQQLKLYFICGTQDIPEVTTIQHVLKEALSAGITMFQFREKGATALRGNDKEKLAIELLELCRAYNVPFIVNDDIELARKIDADGVHVGQDDQSVNVFATQFQDKIIGLSISDEDEYQQSDLTHVDYIGVGPMYQTSSKKDANAPVGPSMIPTLRAHVGDLPIVAIGGIQIDNTNTIMQHGADGVSVISAIAQSSSVSNTVRQFLQTVE